MLKQEPSLVKGGVKCVNSLLCALPPSITLWKVETFITSHFHRIHANSDTVLSVRLAKLVVDKVLTAPCGTRVLYPSSGGNLHCFTAVSPCAMLDILTPPYLEEAGRKCTYYHDYPYSSFGITHFVCNQKSCNLKNNAVLESFMTSCPLCYYFFSSNRRWRSKGRKRRRLCMACRDRCTKYLYAFRSL